MEEMFDPSKLTYADVVLQVLSAYLSSDDLNSYDLANEILDMHYSDPEISGPGFMPGVFFSSIVHMTLMLKILAMSNGISVQEALRKYAFSFEGIRDKVCQMPQVHPSIVNHVIENLRDK